MLRVNTAWIWLRSRVRWHTRLERCAIRRRRARVASSGAHTSGRKSAAPSCASTRASILSVLTFAEAIARVRIGFDTVTRPACFANSSAIAHVIAVDSRTTWSSGPSDSANARNWPISTRPSRRSPPSSCTATSAKRLWTSGATVLTVLTSLVIDDTIAGRPGNTTPTDSRSTGATGQVEGATRYQHGLHGPHARRPALSLSSPLPLFRSQLLRDRGQRPLFYNRYQSDRQHSTPSHLAARPPPGPMSANTPHHKPPLDAGVHLRRREGQVPGRAPLRSSGRRSDGGAAPTRRCDPLPTTPVCSGAALKAVRSLADRRREAAVAPPRSGAVRGTGRTARVAMLRSVRRRQARATMRRGGRGRRALRSSRPWTGRALRRRRG